MRNYWTRIALGAAGIFVAGMFVVTLVGQGVNNVREHLSTGGVISLPFTVGSFRLNGDRIGAFQGIRVDRHARSAADRIQVTVQLDGGEHLSELKGCNLLVDNGNFGPGSGFSCVNEADLAEMALRQVGEVRFTPSGLTSPVYTQGHQGRSARRDGRRSVSANADFGDDDLQFSAVTSEGATVRLQADGDGARLTVRAASGRQLVNLHASDNNGVIRVRNSAGKEVVKISTDVSGQ